MNAPETIAAVASGWARSECAIVRLSGPGVRAMVEGGSGAAALFEGASLEPHSIQSARFVMSDSPRRLTMPCLLMTFVGPRSYTGEDAAEMLVPGSPVVLERVVARLASRPGVREAGPGEFSARAYLNEKLTLAQAEGVAALIGAQGEAELEAARGLLEGRTGATYRAWSEEAATLLALVEAGIDFTDQEDVVAIAPADLAARLEALIEQVGARVQAAGGAERPMLLPRVVLAGAPNAGKSTLFNALLGRRRAVTSEAAGTTRDVLEETLDLSGEVAGGGQVLLVDLAGIDSALVSGGPAAGESDVSAQIEAEAQRRAREAIDAADVVVHCDPSGRFALELLLQRRERELSKASRLARSSRACALVSEGMARGAVIRVRTKADLPGAGMADAEGESVAVCALDGWNLAVLRRAIADAAWGAGPMSTGGTPAAFLLPRHRRALADALGRLGDALEMARADVAVGSLGAPELVAGALRGALDSLGELTGRITPDEVIGRVFATFCVGK